MLQFFKAGLISGWDIILNFWKEITIQGFTWAVSFIAILAYDDKILLIFAERNWFPYSDYQWNLYNREFL